MGESSLDQIALFRSQIQNLRFGRQTLSILQSLLLSRDVKSLTEVRSNLAEFLRCQSISALQSLDGKPVDEKLSVVEFFVGALALVGDVESCLALKYEALILREIKYMNCPLLHVSFEEWVTFAEDSFDNGFYSMAVKGYENALLRIQPETNEDYESGVIPLSHLAVEKIKQHRDQAQKLVASQSVQTQAAEYLRSKAVQQNQRPAYSFIAPEQLATSAFRNGIKKRNLQKLHESQRLYENVGRSDRF